MESPLTSCLSNYLLLWEGSSPDIPYDFFLPSVTHLKDKLLGEGETLGHWGNCEKTNEASPDSALRLFQAMPNFVAERYLVALHLKPIIKVCMDTKDSWFNQEPRDELGVM